MSDKPTAPEKHIHRLTKGVYDALEKEARKGIDLIPREPLAAGYALGVERVLKLIRDGVME